MPGTITRRHAFRAAGASALLVPASALAAGVLRGNAPAQARSAAPAVAADEVALAGVQETLNRQTAARARGDQAAYMATIDQRNLTWRRIQMEAFAAEAGRGLRPTAPTYAARQVVDKGLGYVKAWLEVTPQGAASPVAHAVWVFRQTDAGWLHSEILNEEIGSRKPFETEHFVLAHFAWDDDVIERIAGVAEAAHARVFARTALSPAGRAAVSVNPTYGAHSALRGYGTWAVFLPGADQVAIRSIESYGAGLTAIGETHEDRLLIAFTHEYAHLVNNGIVPTVKMPKWMVEGFAEYVAENLRGGSMVAALRTGRTMTLERASEVIEWGEDPGRGFTGADIDLAYSHSAHATTYFMERYGQDQFFAVAAAYADSRQWEASFTGVTGTPWAQFERDWISWTRQRYGL